MGFFDWLDTPKRRKRPLRKKGDAVLLKQGDHRVAGVIMDVMRMMSGRVKYEVKYFTIHGKPKYKLFAEKDFVK